MLNKLDEFGEHLDITHNYSSNTCGKVIPQLMKEKEQLVLLFNQIDLLDKYVTQATKRVHLLNLIVNDVELSTKSYSKYVPSILRKKPTKTLDRLAKEYNMKEFFAPCHPSVLGIVRKSEELIPENLVEEKEEILIDFTEVQNNNMVENKPSEDIIENTVVPENHLESQQEISIVDETQDEKDGENAPIQEVTSNDVESDDSDDEAGGGMITFGEDSEDSD